MREHSVQGTSGLHSDKAVSDKERKKGGAYLLSGLIVGSGGSSLFSSSFFGSTFVASSFLGSSFFSASRSFRSFKMGSMVHFVTR